MKSKILGLTSIFDEIILQDLGRLGNLYLLPTAGTARPPDRVPVAGTGYYDTLYVSGPGCRVSKASDPVPAAGTGYRTYLYT